MITLAAANSAPQTRFYFEPHFSLLWDLTSGAIGLVIFGGLVAAVIRAWGRFSFLPSSTSASTPLTPLNKDYRQKLAHWLSSATLLLTLTVLCVCALWFIRFPILYSDNPGGFFAVQMALPLAGTLEPFILGFLPVFIWHVADFIEVKRPEGKFLLFLTSHSLIFGILFASGLALILDSTGWFTVFRPCGGSFVLLMESCIGPAPAIGLPLRLLVLTLPLLSLLKVVIALRSRLRRAR